MSTPLRTQFRLDPERLTSLLQEEARPFIRGEPVAGGEETAEEASLRGEQALELLFPPDGDESLISILLSRGRWREIIPGLALEKVVRRAHEEANHRGEIWNPVIDVLAGSTTAHDFLWRVDPNEEPDALQLVEERYVPKSLMAGVSQEELKALLNRPRLRRFAGLKRSENAEEELHPIIGEAKARGVCPVHYENTLTSPERGDTRALLLGPHIEALEDPDELVHLLKAFRSDGCRTMAALFTPVLSREAVLEFAQTPDALGALIYNPAAREWLLREDGVELLARWAIRDQGETEHQRVERVDERARSNAARLAVTLAPHGAPPFSEELAERLKAASENPGNKNGRVVGGRVVEELRMADPGNTEEDLVQAAREDFLWGHLELLCHPSATPEVAEILFNEEAGGMVPGRQNRVATLRSSSYWRATPAEGGEDPEVAKEWRREFLRKVLQDERLSRDELEAIAQSEDADEAIWNELVDRHTSQTVESTQKDRVLETLFKRNDVLRSRTFIDRLLEREWSSAFELLFNTPDPEIWTRVAEAASKTEVGFQSIRIKLEEGEVPPPGGRVPMRVIRRMLASKDAMEREAALRAVGEEFADKPDGAKRGEGREEHIAAESETQEPPSPRRSPSR